VDFGSEIDDFESNTIKNQKYLYKDRRFLLGKDLPEHSSLRKFTPKQLGLTGEVEVQIPKSINRLRLKGSGSRFVHGGASLQEIVVPVVKINKKRQSDVSSVAVDIIRSSSTVISSGQLSVAFFRPIRYPPRNMPVPCGPVSIPRARVDLGQPRNIL